MIERDLDTRDLTERMHARIGPSGAVYGDRAAFESGKRLFEEALHRVTVCLPLPANEPGPVVGERELEIAHPRAT
jgi:hypothetical protein